jgi:hypothetical protein
MSPHLAGNTLHDRDQSVTLYWEIITVYSEDRQTHTNTLCGLDAYLQMLKQAVFIATSVL